LKYNLKKAKEMMKKGFSWNKWLMGCEAELLELKNANPWVRKDREAYKGYDLFIDIKGNVYLNIKEILGE